MVAKGFMGLALALVTAAPAMADFLPPNNLHLQDNVNLTQGITEDEFNEVIDEVEAAYTAIVKEHDGAILKIARKWNDSTVNASAIQIWKLWMVNMYGGLARRPEVTRDGFTMVLCHELGHHLAGFPFVSSWAANEGQSDYFAALSCTRLLWNDEHELNAKARDEIEEYPRKLCDENFQLAEEQNLCYRTMLASKSLSDLLAHLGETEVAYDTPDESEVDSTDGKHPAAQCRLDTFIAGVLCKAQFDPAVIPQDEEESRAHTCNLANGDEVGNRPHCWFKPGE